MRHNLMCHNCMVLLNNVPASLPPHFFVRFSTTGSLAAKAAKKEKKKPAISRRPSRHQLLPTKRRCDYELLFCCGFFVSHSLEATRNQGRLLIHSTQRWRTRKVRIAPPRRKQSWWMIPKLAVPRFASSSVFWVKPFGRNIPTSAFLANSSAAICLVWNSCRKRSGIDPTIATKRRIKSFPSSSTCHPRVKRAGWTLV